MLGEEEMTKLFEKVRRNVTHCISRNDGFNRWAHPHLQERRQDM